MRTNLLLTSVLVSLLFLGGCGGGSSSNDSTIVVAPPVEPPVDPPVEPPVEPLTCDDLVTTDDTNTGCLVAPAFSGVAYETATHRGVTGPRGDFQYEDGETVRFMIGGTLLGEVTGQQLVTPFDLAGSAVVTGGSNITAALGNKADAFQAVVNITTLLQSLDQDGNPDNGVEINPEVVALFADVNLDVGQHWKTFRNQYKLRHALEQANELSLFSDNHDVANPAEAVQTLYRTLKIDDRIFFISSWTSSFIPSNLRWNYDANGYLIDYGLADIGYEYGNDGTLARVASPASFSEGDEGLGSVKKYRYEYNEAGNLTLLETEVDEKQQILYPPPFETTSISTETREYDASGALTQIERQVETVSGILDGVPTTNEIWKYDVSGNVTLYEKDDDGDGVPDHIEKSEFNANGDLTLKEEGKYEFDEAGKYWVVTIWENRYDDEGRLVKVTYDSGSVDDVVGDDTPLWTADYQYDVQDRPIRVEFIGEELSSAAEKLGISYIGYLEIAETYLVTYEYDPDGNLLQEILDGFSSVYGRRIVTNTYDVRGNVRRVEDQIMPLPGVILPDYEKLYSLTEYGYEYNDFGNVISRTTDEGGDGTIEHTESWQYEYDTNGNLTHYKSDFSDNTFQYEPIGWGHIFASPPPDPDVDSQFSWAWPGVTSPLDWYLL
ncbi:MAG: hypothetical protein R3E64_11940 [Halioglobus sp.]